MTRSRAETVSLVRRIPAPALRRPRTQAAWSVRDVLVHIAAWEAEGARRLALIARGAGDRIVWYDTTAELDAFNTRVVRAARRRGPEAVMRRLAAARARLLAGLRRLPAAALADPAHARPVTRWLREFAWTHEGAHRREIRAWARARHAGGVAREPTGRRPSNHPTCGEGSSVSPPAEGRPIIQRAARVAR
jgi:hypothetical protein